MNGVSSFVRMCWMAAWAVWSLLTPAVAAGQATPGSRVLVMPFAADVEPGAAGGTGATLWLGEAASLLIGEGLATRGVGTMAREDRIAAFARLNVPMTPALTRATMIRIGELMGATEIVFGNMRLGDRLEIRARLVHLPTGREMPAVDEHGELTDIFEVFGRVANRLSSHTGRVRPVRPAPPPLALDAFESYLKGLVATTPVTQQRFLEGAVRLAPHDPRILMALWDVYTTQGDHERALAAANAVPAGAADQPRARFAVALSMIELQRFDGAWDVLTALHRTTPVAAVSSALGVVQLRRGAAPGMNEPVSYFARAVNEDPENTDHLFNLGYAYARARNAPDALTWLREVVRLDAADGDAHLLMSTVLASTGRTTEAQRELELARLLGGADREPATLTLSAQVPEGLERLPAPVALFGTSPVRTAVANPAQRDQQETAQFHLANGRAHFEVRRDRDAIGELRRAIYLSPYEEEPHRLLGYIYQRAGRLAEAIEQFTIAIWCRETAAGRLALGSALLDSGRGDAAKREVERALLLDPQSADARALLQRIGG